MNKRIAVVGAGITGLLAAYFLSKAGHSVAVFEQEKYPAMRTSFANGGQVSVSNSEVWTTWGNVRKGLKWVFQKDAPLLIRPSFSISKIAWLSKFLYHTARGTYESNTRKTIQMGLESRVLYDNIIASEQLEFDQTRCGILHIYKNQNYLDAAVTAGSIYQNEGCEWDIFGPDQTRSVDRTLKDMPNIIGSAWTLGDWTGDIHKFCQHLTTVLKNKYNVEFFFDYTIDCITDFADLHEFNNVVVSAGIGSVNLAKRLGDSLPIYPVKGYSVTINIKDQDLAYVPKISLLDDQAKIVTSTLGNRLRVAGTAELDGENYDIRRDRIEPLLNWVHTNFPKIDTSDYSSWACLRPMTPNMMPIVEQSKQDPRVFYHTGHGHLGWTLSPSTAKLLTKLINEDN